MKIVLLADSLGFGGAQRQIANLTVELKALGHKVVFMRYYEDDFYLPLLQKAEIAPITIQSNSVWQRLRKIRKQIHKEDPDFVISFDTTPNFCACFAAIGKHRWKTIVSERVAQRSGFCGKRAKLMKGMQARYADAIVCNSKCAQKLWEEYYPQTAGKLHTIYNIIDVPQMESQTPQDGKCRLLIAARYEVVKNLKGLLKAVMLLTPEEREQLEIHWYGNENAVVGAESVLQNGKRFVDENGLENVVFLHPATDKIHEKMAGVDFISLFSHIEGLPNSIIEGMSLKKPVVMSKVSDYDVLVGEENGFCCDPKSPEDIAEAIRKAIRTTPEQRREMGLRSYEKIKNVCSREAVIAQWSKLIEKM